MIHPHWLCWPMRNSIIAIPCIRHHHPGLKTWEPYKTNRIIATTSKDRPITLRMLASVRLVLPPWRCTASHGMNVQAKNAWCHVRIFTAHENMRSSIYNMVRTIHFNMYTSWTVFANAVTYHTTFVEMANILFKLFIEVSENGFSYGDYLRRQLVVVTFVLMWFNQMRLLPSIT